MPDDPEEQITSPSQSTWPLERRASGKSGARGTGADNSPAIIAADQVKALVLKHCQRYSRDARPFSVASLDILEYEHVRSMMGPQAAEQLERLGKLVCVNTLRGSDRVCFFEPGHILILLPDTESKAAKSVMQRITQSIAAAAISYRNKPLRASGAFLTASCSSPENHTAQETIVVPDAEALLEAVGYKFDELGNLYNSQLSSMRLFTRKKLTFSGSFSVWSDRYVNMHRISSTTEAIDEGVPAGIVYIRANAQDQWQAGRTVKIKMFELADKGAKFDAERLALVARRARILQQIDHPGLSKLIDFHSYEQKHLYLVENPVEGELLADLKPNLESVLNWGIQLCNTLIYLQGLMPPLIPPQIKEENFAVSADSQLIMFDYEVPYVLYPLSTSVEDDSQQRQTQDLHERFSMESLIDFLRVLIAKAGHDGEILGLEKKDRQFEQFSTLFKVRSELKNALDNLTQPTAR